MSSNLHQHTLAHTLLQMSRYGHSGNPPPSQTSQSNPTAPSQTSPTSQSNRTAPLSQSFLAPVLVHANYCGDKVTCFHDRGLWLLTGTSTHSDNSLPSTLPLSLFPLLSLSPSSLYSPSLPLPFTHPFYSYNSQLFLPFLVLT